MFDSRRVHSYSSDMRVIRKNDLIDKINSRKITMTKIRYWAQYEKPLNSDRGWINSIRTDKGNRKMREALVNAGYYEITKKQFVKMSERLSNERELSALL